MGLNQGEVYSKSHPAFTTPRSTHNTGTVERPRPVRKPKKPDLRKPVDFHLVKTVGNLLANSANL